MKQPSDALLSFLDTIQAIVGEDYLASDYSDSLSDLTSFASINTINDDPSHPLWWFLPAILYDLFDGETDHSWLNQQDTSNVSLIVVPPPFLDIVKQIRVETETLGITTEISTRAFSTTFVGLLYGGFPWFNSYFRIAHSRGLFGLECVLLRATSSLCDVPLSLERYKKRRRSSLKQAIQIEFSDLPYPGVVRAFHTPTRIETRRHLLAAENCI